MKLFLPKRMAKGIPAAPPPGDFLFLHSGRSVFSFLRSLFFLLLCGTWIACAAGTEELLRIGDASTGVPLEPLRFAILLLHEKEPALRITFFRCTAQEGLTRLAAGELDMLLTESRSIPQDWAGERVFYGAQALVCYKNAANPLTTLSLSQLREIWQEKEPAWTPYNGEAWNIHRIGVDPFRDNGLERSFLPPGQQEAKIFRVREVRLGFPFLSPAALLCGAYVAERGANCPVLAIEGVSPSVNSILSGKYPLSFRYEMLAKKSPSPAILALWEIWRQDASYRAGREAGLILAAPTEKKE